MEKEKLKKKNFNENKKWNISEISLIIVNLIPLFGVLFLDWGIFSILIIYWLESAVIGFYTILKMILCWRPFNEKQTQLLDLDPKKPESAFLIMNLMAKTAFIPGFLILFGGYMFVHLMFILFFNGIESFKIMFQELSKIYLALIITSISLLVSHGISFYTNFIKNEEYKKTIIQKLWWSPYPRVIVMHLALIFGGIILLLTQIPAIFISIFIFLKIIIDLMAHRVEHKKFLTNID
jgi:hypothetical protein